MLTFNALIIETITEFGILVPRSVLFFVGVPYNEIQCFRIAVETVLADLSGIGTAETTELIKYCC